MTFQELDAAVASARLNREEINALAARLIFKMNREASSGSIFRTGQRVRVNMEGSKYDGVIGEVYECFDKNVRVILAAPIRRLGGDSVTSVFGPPHCFLPIEG